MAGVFNDHQSVMKDLTESLWSVCIFYCNVAIICFVFFDEKDHQL